MIKKKTTDTMPLLVRQSSQNLYMHSVVIASFFILATQFRPAGRMASPRPACPAIEASDRKHPAFTVDEPPKIVHYSNLHCCHYC
jgi:hypothetical protein